MKKTLTLAFLIFAATFGHATHLAFEFGGQVRSVDPITGKTRELADLGIVIQASAVANDGTIYLGTAGGEIHRYDPGSHIRALVGITT